ncbi:ComE operon protein 2 [Halalkalibacterium halodurans]|uniref:ComE operon protein 2 n=1 Tax=Halalkalibacterium halodurans TaxID=86665 RepID=UPI002AA97E94|nr:ComE operon protein 2 [Halalkalibacterium halodurans]MDY7221861.1 ComE operon protein 2 [Halalkalibacterium halodurans]MDY7241137.1 ComE operon protein 2 [Halalkalibacterium halodurans]
MNRISWDQYFMAQSHLLALRSTCTRLMVGATIVRDKRIIAGGYNGSISGGPHCIDEGCYVVEGHCIRTIHAEVNALLQCAKFGVPTEGAEIYVTHFPCVNCTKAIIQSGIKKVYYATDYKNSPYAEELFRDAEVDVEQVELEEMILDRHNEEKLTFTADLLKRLAETGYDEAEIRQLHEKANRLYTSS